MQRGPGQPWDGATGAIAVQTHHAPGSAPGAPLRSEDRRRTGRPGVALAPCPPTPRSLSSAHGRQVREGADVKLINTDGMAFIGPGSEWFWTALSGLILAVTFIAIYRQLRLQASANAFAQMDAILREFDSERMNRYKLDVFLAMRDGTDRANLPEGAAATIMDFWEKVGNLVRSGHVDRALLYEQSSIDCQRWWATLSPVVLAIRERTGQPKMGEWFEWLAGVFAAGDRRAGSNFVLDDTLLTASLDHAIAQYRDDLRVWESLRTVIVKSADPAEPTAPVGLVAATSTAQAQ